MVIKARIKRNTYFDSITLMKIARTLTGMDGVEDAAAIMATETNLQLLKEADLTPFDGGANSGQKQPRSLEQALQIHPDASLAVISVPGPYAALEADRALRAGLHV